MAKKVIVVDLDDTTWDFNGPFAVYMNKQIGTSVRHEDILTFSFQEVYGLPPEEMAGYFHEFCHHHHHHIPLNKDADRILGKLAQRNTLIGVTARNDSIAEITVEHIKELGLRDLFDDIYFTNEGSKLGVCKTLGVQTIIDDALHNIQEASDAGILGIMMDQPWNQRVESFPMNACRVYSWEHIGNLLSP